MAAGTVGRGLRIARHTLVTGISHHEPEMSGVRADRGNTEYYDWRMDRIRLPDGTDGLVCYFADISSQVWARHALAVSENRYRTLFESIDEGFCIVEVIFDDEERPSTTDSSRSTRPSSATPGSGRPRSDAQGTGTRHRTTLDRGVGRSPSPASRRVRRAR